MEINKKLHTIGALNWDDIFQNRRLNERKKQKTRKNVKRESTIRKERFKYMHIEISILTILPSILTNYHLILFFCHLYFQFCMFA